MKLLWSVDGEQWNEGETVKLPPELPGWAFWFRNAAAGNGIYLFMGNANNDQNTWRSLTSRDGEKIESFSLTAQGRRGLAFGAGKCIAVDERSEIPFIGISFLLADGYDQRIKAFANYIANLRAV